MIMANGCCDGLPGAPPDDSGATITKNACYACVGPAILALRPIARNALGPKLLCCLPCSKEAERQNMEIHPECRSPPAGPGMKSDCLAILPPVVAGGHHNRLRRNALWRILNGARIAGPTHEPSRKTTLSFGRHPVAVRDTYSRPGNHQRDPVRVCGYAHG